MNREKEIQEAAKAIEKAKMMSLDNSVWYKIAAGYLYSAGFCNIQTFSEEFFERAYKYVAKWHGRAEEEKDNEYAWGMRSVCTSVKSKIDEMVKEPLIREATEKEKQIAEMARIIHFCACGTELHNDDTCADCSQTATNLLALGYSNRFVFLNSFFETMKIYLKEEVERTKTQIHDDKDDAQYAVGKIYVCGRFEEKIKTLEEESQKELTDAELFLKRMFSNSKNSN